MKMMFCKQFKLADNMIKSIKLHDVNNVSTWSGLNMPRITILFEDWNISNVD